MKGSVPLKTGHHVLSDDMSMDVRGSDVGTVISIFYRQKLERHTVTFDEHGEIVDRKVQRVVQGTPIRNARDLRRQSSIDSEKSATIPVFYPLKRPTTAITFTLKYSSGDREKDCAVLLGGFTDGSCLHALYRIKVGERLYAANQLRIDGERSLAGAQIPEDDRLPHDRLQEVCVLSPDESFTFGGKTCRVLSIDDLNPLISGQTIVIDPPLIG